jgi:hypothetical protein
MSKEPAEMRMQYGLPSADGHVQVTVSGPNGPIHVDRVRLAIAVDRERFVADTMRLAPALDEHEIREALIHEARRPRSLAGKPTSAPPASVKKGPPRKPYPVHLLPEPVRAHCEAVAHAQSVDVSVPAALSLAAMASAIGGARSYWDAQQGWEEPSVVWLMMVMPSGKRKTPAMKAIFAPHRRRQSVAKKKHDAEMRDYQAKLDDWELERRQKRSEGRPRPVQPKLRHIWTSDSTVEGAGRILAESPHGLVVLSDEVSSFIAGLGKYSKGGPATDMGFWLSAHSGAEAKVDRASKEPLIIEKPLVSVAGGIQPLLLARVFDDLVMGSGMAARFLFVWPPDQRKEYPDSWINETADAYGCFIDALFELPWEPYMDEWGQPGHRTLRVPIGEDVREILREFVPAWDDESREVDESMGAACAKLEGYALRLALVFRVGREVTGQCAAEDPLTVEDLQKGIELARWHRDEAERCYLALGRGGNRSRERVVALNVSILETLGGAASVREWRQRNTRRTTEQAEAELQELVDAGVATWEVAPASAKGGRPTRRCVLVDPQGVSGCTTPTDRASDGDSGDGGRKTQSGEVSGCGLRGASSAAHDIGPGGVKNGGGDRSESGFEEGLHPETSTDHRSLGSGDLRVHREGCTPQPATRNPLLKGAPGATEPDHEPAPGGPARGQGVPFASSGDPFVDQVKSLFEDPPTLPPPRRASAPSATPVPIEGDRGHADELPWDVLLGSDADAPLRSEEGAA